MLRSKRQRSSQSHHHEHGGGGSDDELLRMNPSLMTERQQFAFLLRKTAQDASASDSAQSSDSSEDELIQSFAKGARRIQRTYDDVGKCHSTVAFLLTCFLFFFFLNASCRSCNRLASKDRCYEQQ